MKYLQFKINRYKAIKDSKITLNNEPISIIGLNESGKSSTLEAIASFDYRNDTIASSRAWSFTNRYLPQEGEFSVEVEVNIEKEVIDAELSKFTDPEKQMFVGIGLTSHQKT